MIKINDVNNAYEMICKKYENDKRVEIDDINELFNTLIDDFYIDRFDTTFYIFENNVDLTMLIHVYDNDVCEHDFYVIDYDDFEIIDLTFDDVIELIDVENI